MGSQINLTQSPYDENITARLCVVVLTIVLFSICVILIKQLNGLQIIFILFGMWLTGMFQPMSLRVITGLLGVIIFYRSLISNNHKRKILWAVMAGAFAFMAQLLSFEAGIYVIGTLLLVTIFLFLLNKSKWRLLNSLQIKVIEYIKTFGISLGTFLIGNISISVWFIISSSNYNKLFEYQTRSLEIISAYSRTVGNPWMFWKWVTIAWFMLIIATLILTLIHIWSSSSNEAILFICLLIYSLISVKSAITRANPSQLIHGTFAIFFTFLVLGKPPMRFPYLITWSFIITFFASTWVGSDLNKVYYTKNLLLGRFSLQKRWTELRMADNSKISSQLFELINRNPNTPLLAFPYQNYIPIISHRIIVAPFLQTYVTGSIGMQEEYVSDLQKYPSEFEIIYGIDKLASLEIDEVQNITRTPIIFEYIYNNYQLADPFSVADGYILLDKRQDPKKLSGTPITFTILTTNNYTSILFQKPVACSLLKLNLSIDYPFWSVIGYSVPIHVALQNQSETIAETNIVELSSNEPFQTYVNLLSAEDFPQIFGDGNATKMTIDKMEINNVFGGIFGIQPSSTMIKSIDCITP
jgi:hypothetical protein